MNIWQLGLVAVITTFCTVSSSLAAQAAWPAVDLTQMGRDGLAVHRVTVSDDPVYGGEKHYQGYALADILKRLSLPEGLSENEALLVFTAADGYRVAMRYTDASAENGYVALRDLDARERNWLTFKFGKETMTPAPFYLVWVKSGLDKWRFPWPFQLVTISIEPEIVFYGAAAPSDGGETVRKGFSLFSRYCIRCHSVNGVGGEVGPELNRPRSVTEYFREEALGGFILNAAGYREGTKMPDFKDELKPADIDALIAYLKRMKSEKTE